MSYDSTHCETFAWFFSRQVIAVTVVPSASMFVLRGKRIQNLHLPSILARGLQPEIYLLQCVQPVLSAEGESAGVAALLPVPAGLGGGGGVARRDRQDPQVGRHRQGPARRHQSDAQTRGEFVRLHCVAYNWFL